ncbi:MAG: HesA/MoeB/ThiF family protein, partial [Methanobrevibacter sp.]|nr:HesA/MoeB/ThiF family protein [Methanobrevibacter sp.]
MNADYWEIILRQISLLDKSEQEKFKNTTITVIGCGGIGGETIEMLARLGVGKLILVDEDSFELSNFNRQNFAKTDVIGEEKSEVALKQVKLINPNVEVINYTEHVDISNVDKFVKDTDIVIDALDNVLTRVILSRKAMEYKIPFIHGAIHGTMGQLTVFLSNTKSYEELFNLPSLNKELTPDVIESLKNVTTGPPPVIGPAPNIIGCMQAMEAFKIVTGIGKVIV